MSSSLVPVVDILDDDDDLAASTPPLSRKRSQGSRAPGSSAAPSSPDFLDAFSPSPPAPLQKRLLLAAGRPIVLDDTPSPPKPRPSSAPKLPVLVVDDDSEDPTARGGAAADTPDSVLPRAGFTETPESDVPCSDGPGITVVGTPAFTSSRFTSSRSVGPPPAHGMSSAATTQKSSGVSSLISLDSDDESDDTMHRKPLTNLQTNTSCPVLGPGTSFCSAKLDSAGQKDYLKSSAGHDTTISTRIPEAKQQHKEEDSQPTELKQKKQPGRKKLTKEEKDKLAEERKRKQQEDKLQRQTLKAQLADKKKQDKDIQNWESGKFSLECITAEIDSDVAQSGSIGGPLLSSFAEKGLKFIITKNEISRSILWKLKVPDHIARALSSRNDGCDMNEASVTEVAYIAIVLQAEEFCDLIMKKTFFDHVQEVCNKYPTFTICYITNKLMSYINKCEQSQFKNPSSTWRRPPVEEVLCKLATHYIKVHSRQCIDEAEVAEHIVGLTSSLAKCKFRKPLTWLSVHANGAVIPKGFVDKELAKKDTWLKALIAIPDIQPRYALAIWKKYPNMRSLLNVYMDPSKTILEKELLLSDLKWEDRLGNEAKRLGKKCSTRVYRILMAPNGDLDTDSPEAGGASKP